MQNSKRLWIVILFLGWSFDFLFWDLPLGINFTIFVILLLLGGLYLLYSSQRRPSWRSLLLILPAVFSASMTFIRQEPLTVGLSITFTILTTSLLAISYLGGKWPRYNFWDYVVKYLRLMESMITQPAIFVKSINERLEENGEDNAPSSIPLKERLRPVWAVLRGLLIAFPILLCFGSLLVSADAVFNQKLIDFFKMVTFEKFFEYILRFMLVLVYAYLILGVLLHAALKSNDTKLQGEERPLIKPFIGMVETGVALGSVVVLFLLFVIVQFQYFFGGSGNITIEGYTFSEYARRGFWELILVGFFSMLMLMGFSVITRRDTRIHQRLFSILNIAIVAEVLVILVSAYHRLNLGIMWHGYSRLRLYPRIFLIWTGILLLAVFVLEILRRQRYFTFALLFASFGFAATLGLYNVDASIVRFNVHRVLINETTHFNVSHLTSLSVDAVPPLVDEFLNSPYLSDTTREGAGAALLCYYHSSKINNNLLEDWRSFNLSQWRAERAITKAEAALDEYFYSKEDWGNVVRTPSGELYECAGWKAD